ncbi:MAG: pyruvate:ferredoxin (flavodoxin) oxidoreductase [Alphaproteobacteria bacterium]
MYKDLSEQWVMVDGNEAAAHIAYKTSEICPIYPITPSSTMAELADEWSALEIKNIFGEVPQVVSLQSEAGAAGTLHGALQVGALSSTFTASQGLMLMLPNMYKIAGELTPCVIHVAARSLATQGLSIFGDHQDVMAARTTGFAMLSATNVQEAQDMAMIAHATTLKARIPFLHFFDGFRTSHEVAKIKQLSDDHIKQMIDNELVLRHRERALNPEHPAMRGTAQNPDTYFQSRETVNRYYEATPSLVQESMNKFAQLTGRKYNLMDYYGAPDATKVIIIMGSGSSVVRDVVEDLTQKGEKIGVVVVRLYRPFSVKAFNEVLPQTVEKIAVLDRTKEPGSTGEPLYQDVTAAFSELMMDKKRTNFPLIVGGRYGLSSKEFTPAMAKAVFDELNKNVPQKSFTVGIIDDVTHKSLSYDNSYNLEIQDNVRALFYGLGSDGTVGANKNSIKIIGDLPEYYAQGYFVYDSKKSGSQTISHLRFGKKPIEAPYLVQKASFIACHQPQFVSFVDMLSNAEDGATFLLNTHYGPEEVWQNLPISVQTQILDKNLKFYVIDAYDVANKVGMGRRINTIMQTCFFALAGVMPEDEAIALIKKAIEKTYSRKGADVVQSNFAAVDGTLENLYKVEVPNATTGRGYTAPIVPEHAPHFIKDVTARMMAGQGDDIPVSRLPADGTYPTGTTKWEKRDIAQNIPIWRDDLCIQCGNCSFVCPHAAIRAKFYNKDQLKGAPLHFQSQRISARGFPETRYTLQVFPEDCTGCEACVVACPVRHKDENGQEVRAINMEDKIPHLSREKENCSFFQTIPNQPRRNIDFSNVRGVQYLEPLFEFSGACAGCGETPYLKLITQLFGDRLLVANATGCSSIYGGNLPTTPWTKNDDGRGPAWSNSLFEDNAEFGLGFRLAASKQRRYAESLLKTMKDNLDPTLVDEVVSAPQFTQGQISIQRERLAKLSAQLANRTDEASMNLKSVLDYLIRRSIWIVGGDGWAYDIGSSGIDHVLSSGKNVNILVMDTEVYSNTGGQNSKSTPMGAVAKFAAGGKNTAKKDLALQAISYGNVYVARIAYGADPQQTLRAMREAEAYPGVSLVIAYSHCIAHGIDMAKGAEQQQKAVHSGHWPLIRYNPVLREKGQNPFSLDSLRPSIPLAEYRMGENRFRSLIAKMPKEAERLLDIASEVSLNRWAVYEEMATRNAATFHPDARTEKEVDIAKS